MLRWGVHLSIAKKVSEKYKEDRNKFYFASLAIDARINLVKSKIVLSSLIVSLTESIITFVIIISIIIIVF